MIFSPGFQPSKTLRRILACSLLIPLLNGNTSAAATKTTQNRSVEIAAATDPKFQATVDKIIRGNLTGIDTATFLVDLENQIARKPGQESWLKAAGMLHFQSGRYDRARRLLLQLRKPATSDDRLIALSLFEMKEYRKALVYFGRLREVRSTRGDWEKYCQALALGGPKAEALKEWEAYRQRYAASDAAGQSAGLDFLAECYRRPLQKEKLLPILDALLKRNKGQADEGKYLLEISKLYGETHIKAVELRDQYLKLHPEDFAAARELAEMHEARGDAGKALPIMLQIAPHFTSDLKFNRHLAGMLTKTDKEKALLFFEVCRTLAPKDFKIPLEMARLQETLKRPELALEAYKAVLDINPTHPESKSRMLALTAASASSGPWLQAMVENEKKNPKDHVYQFQLAKLFLAAQDKVNAYKFLEKALLHSHDNEEYALLLPRIIGSDAQILKYFSLLQKLAAKADATPELLVLVGRGHSLYHNQPKAAEAYAKVMATNPKLLENHRQPILELFSVKDYAAAGTLAEKFVLADPKDADVRRIQVTSLVEMRASPVKVRGAIQALIALEPYDDKWYLRLAELDLAAKDTAAALKHGYEWVKMHPEDKRGLLFLEPLAIKTRDGEAYFNTMDKLARLEPANQSQYELKSAYFLFETGKFSQAAEALAKLTSAFQNDAKFWNRLGTSQMKLGREGAGTALEKSYRLEPGNPEYARGFAAALNSDQELKANVDVFQTLRRANPDQEEKRKLAHALFLVGNFGSSAQAWDGLLGMHPELAIADSTAGMAYFRAGQIAKAKPILEKRLAANPRDVGLLATLSELYGKEGDVKRRMEVMERLVQEDQNAGDFVLRLAREKEKAGLGTEALALYSQWCFRYQSDLPALKAYHALAEKQKDTTALIEVLRHLTQPKDADRNYRFQLAELYFVRSGDIKDLEDLAKAYPDYRKGKSILVTEYHSKAAWDRLAGMEAFLISESATNSDLLESLADLYAQQKKIADAHRVYYSWLAVRRTQRDVFDKVYAYARENQGPNLIPILKLGCDSYPDDLALKAAYGAAMGNTRSALDAYQTVLAKEPDNLEALAQATEIAKALGDRASEARWAKKWSELKPDEEKPWRYLMESLNPSSDKGKMADAMEGLLRIMPGNLELELQLARLQEELGRFDKAIGLYRNALYLNPKDKAVRDRLVTLMKEKGKKEDLADVLTEIQNIDSSAHEAQFELAKLYLQKRDKNKAYAYLISALDQSPLNQNYQRLLPRVIHTREQTSKHFKLLMEIAGRPETVRSDANNADLFELLAQGYAYQGKWEESANYYAAARKLDVKRLAGDRDALIACYRGKNFALTSELADKYFELNGDFDKEIRQIQILSYEKTMKDPALIRKTLQLLLALDKENAGGQLRLAELDLRAKDTSAAITNIRNCLTTSPNELRGYKMLLPLINIARNEQRVTYVVVLEKLIQLDSLHKADHLIQLADFYFNRKLYRQTARLLTQVSELRPQDANTWYRLGQCRNQLQVGDQGVGCFKKAYDMQPSNLAFAHTFAQALQTPEQFKANLKLYQFTEDRNPSLHERYGLAMSYFYNGDYSSSGKAWDRVTGDKLMEGKYLPEAALTYMRTAQPAKALPLYRLRIEREAHNLGLLDTLCGLFAKTGDEKGRVSMLEAVVAQEPAYKDFQLQLAKAKESSRDTVAAIENYGQWTARNTTDAEALKSMHRLAQARCDTASLENALRLLVLIKGLAPEYSFQLAELQFKFTGDTGELERLVKAHGGYQRGRVILAKEYFRRYDIPKMIPFEKALADESLKDPQLTGALAELFAYQDKKPQANKAFRDYLVYWNQKTQGAKAAIGLGDLRQAFDKAWLYGDANKSAYLTEILDIGNQAFPGEQPIRHALAAALGKDPRALDIFKLILDKDPNDLTALQRGSELAMTLGRFAEAVTWLERWTAIEPGSTRAWQLLADASTQLKRPAQTADALDHLTLLTPADGPLAFRTAKAYLEAKNREKALEFFIMASELKPKEPAYAFEVMDLLQTMSDGFLANGQTAKAVELYGLILVRDPKHKKANLYMGMWLAENHDYATAGNLLKLGIDQSSESKPVLSRAWRLLGDCQAGRGESQPALEDYKRALTLNPGDSAAAAARLDMTRILDLTAELPLALGDVVRLDSNNGDACRELAENRLKAGDFTPAATLYRRSALANDRDADIWGHYGEALEGAKRNTEAVAAWEKDYALGNRMPYNLFGLSRLLREAGALAKAEKPLEDLVVLQPENDEASAWLAELALSQNRLNKAEEMFAQASQAAPDKIEYTQGLAEVCLQRGDAESALEILEPVRGRLTTTGRLTYADGSRMVGKAENSLPLYQEVYGKAPSVRALVGWADAHMDRHKPAEAKTLIEASKLQSEPVVRLRMAKAQLALHERDKAAEILKALVKENPTNATFLLNLAQVHYERRDLTLALKEFMQALQMRADLSQAAYGTGMIMVANGQFNDGRNYFYALAQSLSKPDRVLGLRGLAAASAAEKKTEEASDYLVQAVEIYPTPEALAELSELSLRLGRVKEAEDYAQRSLESDEDFSDGIVALAETMIAQGHKDEARDFLKEALVRNPRACDMHIEFAKVMVAMENFQGIASNSHQVLSLCPDEPMSYYYAGVGADRAYQKKQAEEYFRSYKKLGGDKAVLPKGY